MDSIVNLFKRKKHKNTPNVKSKSSSLNKSSSYSSSLNKSPSRSKRNLSKKIAKSYKKLNIDSLAKQVDSLHSQAKHTFTRKNKRKTSSKQSSPIILTIRNLDTGEKKQASVVKNINNGKYEFYEV